MKTKQLTLTALFTALTIVFAQLILPLSFTPVPLSLSLLPVYLSGAILPKRHAVYSQLVYLLIGAAGLPVFAGFRGGPGVLFGPTGGFLIAYPMMAFLTAWVLEILQKKTLLSCIPAMLAALTACYLCGSVFYMFVGHVSWLKSLSVTVFPFIAFDLMKVAASVLLAPAINKALIKSRLIQNV
ncbi:biotin transporter BioY [Caproiciproducens faecalis]|uniref:Biotin transporter n=1 Tax=Caproiciproducens faecalis TaxID=2820301 RepID=A0ABS7DNV3_9FIRM|nr:biotin transporter BioY [Caproiciproducens faecalis]MBW7572888.1 biotin transporter BioY [Caproiciproducens faecalis]